MDKYTEIVAFLRAAETQSFTGAARVMKLTPSAVSKLISRLEDRLGVRLFERHAREVVLTHEGRTYCSSAQAVVDAMNEADSVAEALPAKVSGTIRVHTMFTFARYQIAPWLLEFQDSQPGLAIELHIGSQFVDLFDQGIDLAIHSGVLPDSSRVATQISRSRWIICASPAYLAKYGNPSAPAELVSHKLLGFTFSSPWNDWSFREGSTTATIRAEGGITSTHGELLRDLALSGGGIVRLAHFHIWDDLKHGRLVPVLAQYQDDAEEPIFAIYSRRKHLSPRIKLFIQALRSHILSAPWAQ